MSRLLEETRQRIDASDAILIGAGAGLSAAAGLNYLDRAVFAEHFPGWVRRGVTCQYEMMGYPFRDQLDQWGYLTTHLDLVYFSQGANPLYEQLFQILKGKDYFVMTSNVDQLFHKSGFDPKRIYSPQGHYGKIQCTKPCSDTLWDIEEFMPAMRQAMDPENQRLTNPAAVPKCPNCGGSMFMNARIDRSFIETPYEVERERLVQWLNSLKGQKVLVMEFGAGFNTPGVIRYPLEYITQSLEKASMIRVNMDHARLPQNLQKDGLEVSMDIKSFIEGIQV